MLLQVNQQGFLFSQIILAFSLVELTRVGPGTENYSKFLRLERG